MWGPGLEQGSAALLDPQAAAGAHRRPHTRPPHSPPLQLRGRRYGLCGANGAGKSTLMRAISRGQLDGFPPADKLKTLYVEHDIQVGARARRASFDRRCDRPFDRRRDRLVS
jgi:hypothetical protein